MPRPVLDVVVAGKPYVGGPWSMKLRESEGAFDGCILTLPRQQASPVTFAQGTPISVTFGRTRALTTTFPGYVDHVESNRETNTGEAKVVVVGAGAQVLRDAASRAWPVGSSASVAVQQIADKLHLSSLTEMTDIPAPGGPSNESWWHYIRRTARACGFACYVAGTDVRFHSRRIDASGDPVPYFIGYTNARVRTDNVVYSYTASDDDDSGDSVHRKRRVFGVSDEGLVVALTDVGDLESVGGSSQPAAELTRNENVVVHDMGSAASRLTALHEANRFTRQSRFVVSGDETVRQASTVVIRGIRTDLDGYWYVLAVDHRVTSASYSMEILAGRDSSGDTAPVDLAAPVAVVALGRGEPVPAPAPMLRRAVGKASDLVFPSPAATWTASSLLHRQHYPWRAAVRG